MNVLERARESDDATARIRLLSVDVIDLVGHSNQLPRVLISRDDLQ